MGQFGRLKRRLLQESLGQIITTIIRVMRTGRNAAGNKTAINTALE
jgi:hypothetical protein